MPENSSETFIPPRDAGERLGVSPSGLRRLATLYEGLYGPLPRDPSDARIWPLAVVERLESARALVSQGRAKSVQDALQATEPGREMVTLDAVAVRQPSGEAFTLMVRELQALRAEVRDLREHQDAVQRQLPPTDRTAELERMNAYLLGELERRSKEVAPVKRPWWRFWS